MRKGRVELEGERERKKRAQMKARKTISPPSVMPYAERKKKKGKNESAVRIEKGFSKWIKRFACHRRLWYVLYSKFLF